MDQNQLKKRLQEKADALSAEALQKKTRLADERLEELEQLDKLLDIQKKLAPPKARKRWPVALMLGICLAAVSVLLFVRLPKTEIELNAVMTDLHFVLSEETLLSDNMQLQALGASKLDSIQLPREAAQATKSVKISAAESAGTIGLSDLLLPAGTTIDLHSDAPEEGTNSYRLLLEIPQHEAVKLHVTVKGRVNIIVPGTRREEQTYTSPKRITLLPEGRQIALDLSLPEGKRQSFALLQAHSLGFSRIEEYIDTQKSLIRQIPTLLSGDLYFIDLKGKKYALRDSEDLRLEESEGQIRSLALSENRIALKVQAFGSGITTGWGKKRISLMPTLLEWIKAQQAPGLLWGTALFLFGLVNQILRWWKK